MNFDLLKKTIVSAATAALIFCSCGESSTTVVTNEGENIQNAVQTEEPAAEAEAVTSYVKADNSVEKTDFSGLKSGKYAEVFAQQHEGGGYTLKWSYGAGNEDKPQNYIVFDGTDGSYALCLSRPAFNRNKFYVKDHIMYDIYDDDRDYTRTDMNQMAFEMGFFSVDQFEHYSCDIFAGLSLLGSGSEEIDGNMYDYDAYYTDKQIELWFYTDESGALYAIKSISDFGQPCIMYVDEYSDTCDRSYFNIPDGYTEYKE